MYDTTRSRLIGVALLATVLVAACAETPSVPELSDPVAIVEAAATQAASSQSVHVDVTADGTLQLDITGTGAGAPIQLTDSTASLDLDLAAGTAKATFALPGILGLRGELIAVDGSTYIKTSLTGPLYQKSTAADAGVPDPSGSPDPSSVLAMLTEVRTALARPGVDPVKGADVACGSGTCYTVMIQLTPAELSALGVDPGALPLPGDLPIPVPDIGDQTIDLTIRVDKTTTRLAGLTANVAGGAAGDLNAELTFSKWDEALTISAPPADQVAGS